MRINEANIKKFAEKKKIQQKNYGELITCAFNVFHTNFLIKHNCVLTEPSIFLFFLPDHCSSPCPLTFVHTARAVNLIKIVRSFDSIQF